MTDLATAYRELDRLSQSAFVRGFIDDRDNSCNSPVVIRVSIRVRARLHR